MVESLCPQLADFFNVPAGTGVMVRSVEKGSPADAAGLKAGDVIVRLNNETIHDLADWRRALRVQASQVSVTVVREKHEQTVVMHLPAPGGFLEGAWRGLGRFCRADAGPRTGDGGPASPA